jgi:hypothetical protein
MSSGTTVVRTVLARPWLGAEKSVWFAQTVKFGFLLINPFFAQLYSMLLGLLFSFAQLALYSLNLDYRSEPAPLINNTNRRGAVCKFWPCPCADEIAPIFVSGQRRDIATVEKRAFLH